MASLATLRQKVSPKKISLARVRPMPDAAVLGSPAFVIGGLFGDQGFADRQRMALQPGEGADEGRRGALDCGEIPGDPGFMGHCSGSSLSRPSSASRVTSERGRQNPRPDSTRCLRQISASSR